MTDDASAAAKQNWDLAAPGWERNADLMARLSAPVLEWLVEHLGPQPGETFLELAAGPGETGFQIARRLGDGGRLISTDLAPAMVEAAKRRAAAMGITNAEFREMNAQAIDLQDGSVDGVVHRFGPMLLPDPAASASEARRVLRDGGRYATASWSTMERNPLFPIMGRTLAGLGHVPPPPPGEDGTGPGGMSSMADHGKVRAILTGAGFTDVTIEDVSTPMEFRGFEELWKMPSEVAGPIGQIIKRLDDAERERVKDAIREAASPFSRADGFSIPAIAVCTFAR